MLNDDETMVAMSPTVVVVHERVFFVTPRTVDAHESIRSVIRTTLSASSPLGFASSPGVFVIGSMRRIDKRTGSFNEQTGSVIEQTGNKTTQVIYFHKVAGEVDFAGLLRHEADRLDD